MNFAIGGAGFSGAVLARQLAGAGHRCTVFEARRTVAGHCGTERDRDTGVMVHRFGPHIFHTDRDEVWRFVNRFADMRPYQHRVQAVCNGESFPMPINLQTINQYYRTTMTPDQARSFIDELARQVSGRPRETMEDVALATIGPDLYEAFFRGYTEKQWGRSPRELPASIFKRLPVHFTEERSYYAHDHQAVPRDGYTAMVEGILDHPGIDLRRGSALRREVPLGDTDHVFFTGSVDSWFDRVAGPLAYRTLDFEHSRTDGVFQDCAVVNYCDAQVPWTRITEHKHFAPWEDHDRTICSREYSRDAGPADEPFYPVRSFPEDRTLASYVELAEAGEATSFIGRLGTFRYIDMDQAIAEALAAAEETLERLSEGAGIPAFFNRPI